MKILIIEDEARAANQLQILLKECFFNYDLLGILDSVVDVIDWYQKNAAPDLIFMDIQLADGLSFEIFQKVKIEAPIIFTTAFDQYAIQAFKVNSIDYLLKPIQNTDMQAAIDKFTKNNMSTGIDQAVLSKLLTSMQTSNQRKGILVKDGNGFIQIRTEDLQYIYSEDSITFGVTNEGRYIIEETIDHLIQSLDPGQFFRINRGQIISKTAIEKIQPYFNHRVKLMLLNPRNQEFIVSRPKTAEFKSWLNT
ncbi:LytR/AlgR family response regulator transcription factor [Portibacter lacus]|uniref:DNA-binding response regulator n=1 Tax=Portibacter lacus TaxID=1099794 RepID=A0AA37SMA2_9BACT|nr:LytTR family DNA-binding domain-containing protein [Portibacter lacus]GLR16525.1 DNA-binding response regulator [Portibacter lacus]